MMYPKTPFQLFESYRVPGEFPENHADWPAIKRCLKCRDHNIRISVAFSTFEIEKGPVNNELFFTLTDVQQQGAIVLETLQLLTRRGRKQELNGTLAKFKSECDTLNGSVRHMFLLMDRALYRRLPAVL